MLLLKARVFTDGQPHQRSGSLHLSSLATRYTWRCQQFPAYLRSAIHDSLPEVDDWDARGHIFRQLHKIGAHGRTTRNADRLVNPWVYSVTASSEERTIPCKIHEYLHQSIPRGGICCDQSVSHTILPNTEDPHEHNLDFQAAEQTPPNTSGPCAWISRRTLLTMLI